MSEKPLVSVRKLAVDLGERRKTRFRILHGIDLDIFAGETVAVVGESGSGKSTLGRAILGLVDTAEGEISYHGDVLPSLRERRGRVARRSMRVVFQDPYSSLNPSRTVGYSLSQGLRTSRSDPTDTAQRRVTTALSKVGLPAEAAARFPSQFSGGQRQRIAIARALIGRPDFVVCDEPVTALDLSIQAQILNLLMELKASANLTYLFVAHSIPVVRYFADRIVVMKDGRIVEQGTAEQVVENPSHPYTRSLIAAAPIADPELQKIHRETAGLELRALQDAGLTTKEGLKP